MNITGKINYERTENKRDACNNYSYVISICKIIVIRTIYRSSCTVKHSNHKLNGKRLPGSNEGLNPNLMMSNEQRPFQAHSLKTRFIDFQRKNSLNTWKLYSEKFLIFNLISANYKL